MYWQELLKRVLRDNLPCEMHAYPGRTQSAVPLFDQQPEIQHSISAKLALFTAFKHSSKQPYIYHSSYYRTTNDPTSRRILTVHDLILEKLNPTSFKFIKQIPKKRAIEHADILICVSENTKKDLIEYYKIAPERVQVIYNGASEQFRPTNSIDLSLFPWFNPNKKYLLYIGLRSFYKRFDWFAQLINTLDTDTEAIIIGGGPMSPKEYGLFDRKPHVLEYVDTAILNQIYNIATALVYPSTYEGFGIPLVEASRANCPILCFKNSCIPEIVGDYHPLFVDNDTYSLEHACLLLEQLDDDSFRKKVIDSQLLATQAFTWENTYLKTRKVYECV